MRVKICGITNQEDAQKAVYYGASALGFIFYKKSPRYVSPSRVRKIIESLPPFVTPVGVFVDHKERAIRDVCSFARIQTIQLHGDEPAVFCKRLSNFKIIKAFRLNDQFDFSVVEKYKVDAYLFDAYKEGEPGGTGQKFNWELLKGKTFNRPVILSGGLNPNNVREAVDTVAPYALDVSTGLEKAPGLKDPRLLRAFFDVLNFKLT